MSKRSPPESEDKAEDVAHPDSMHRFRRLAKRVINVNKAKVLEEEKRERARKKTD